MLVERALRGIGAAARIERNDEIDRSLWIIRCAGRHRRQRHRHSAGSNRCHHCILEPEHSWLPSALFWAAPTWAALPISEERRVGKEWVSQSRSWWSPYN